MLTNNINDIFCEETLSGRHPAEDIGCAPIKTMQYPLLGFYYPRQSNPGGQSSFWQILLLIPFNVRRFSAMYHSVTERDDGIASLLGLEYTKFHGTNISIRK